jgi:hypothetical protein
LSAASPILDGFAGELPAGLDAARDVKAVLHPAHTGRNERLQFVTAYSEDPADGDHVLWYKRA